MFQRSAQRAAKKRRADALDAVGAFDLDRHEHIMSAIVSRSIGQRLIERQAHDLGFN